MLSSLIIAGNTLKIAASTAAEFFYEGMMPVHSNLERMRVLIGQIFFDHASGIDEERFE